MNERSLVSIVMPAYNAEAFIAESIESVRSQTHANWELIIVNDGSTDATVDTVKPLAKADERIKLFSTSNRGAGPARNYGIQHATGQLIAFLDADDLWAESKLRDQLAEMIQAPADVVFTGGQFIGGAAGDRFVSAVGRFTGPEMFQILYQHNRIPTLSVMTTKAALTRGGMFKETGALARRCEDYDLWLRMATAGCSFLGLPQRLVSYRLHTEGTSRSLLAMEESELEAIEQFDKKMRRDHPELRRQRHIELYNRLIATSAAAHQLARARGYLKQLSQLEPVSRVGSKSILLALFRHRYGGVSRRIFRRAS